MGAIITVQLAPAAVLFTSHHPARALAWIVRIDSKRQHVGSVGEEFMAALLAFVFVLFSLATLLSGDFKWNNASSPLFSNQERISDIGLCTAFAASISW